MYSISLKYNDDVFRYRSGKRTLKKLRPRNRFLEGRGISAKRGEVPLVIFVIDVTMC